MNNLKSDQENDGALVKHVLANKLRELIVSGELHPGQRIIEGRWAREFLVAQASIREAINLLLQEGFVSKAAARSARVISFSKEDVMHVYEMRGAVEGLAARLAAERQTPTDRIANALQSMRQAVHDGDARNLLDADLQFHLELCEASGNPLVVEEARRILRPFFAFVRIRVQMTHQHAEVWERDLNAHQRIIDLIREGEGDVAEQYLRRAMRRFATNAYDSWDKNIS